MATPASGTPFAHLVDPREVETLEVLGPTVSFLTAPEEGDDVPCVMHGTIPPDRVVPLHSHADPETFIALSGAPEGLVYKAEGFDWVEINPGEVFHVPANARHAWRNRKRTPAVSIIVSTAKIARFFREVGAPVRPDGSTATAPSEDEIQRFLEVAARYGYWNATPEENAAVGIEPPG
jgi:quercetin dioxygenase-like cupin family protein